MRLNVFISVSFFILCWLGFLNPALSEIELGSGTSSFTGGRLIPAIELGYATPNQVFTWAATGVRNSYYYQASHQLAFYKTWNVGTMWGGDMNSGFGGALAYSLRSFKDEGSTTENNASDIVIGPCLRMNLSYGFVFFNMAATFGLRDFGTHLTGLSFQDIEFFSMGVRF